MHANKQPPEASLGPSRTTVQAKVYLDLRRALMAGRYEPGHVFTIDAVATAFGTSHMPVREALRRLVAENALVVLRNNSSAMVPRVNKTQLEDIFRSRAIVERAAVEAAVAYRSDVDIEELTNLARQHAASTGDAYGMLDLNQQFHFRLYRCACSRSLMQLIEVLWLSMGPYMRLLAKSIDQQMRDGSVIFVGTHGDIIVGLAARDRVFAGDAIAADIRATQRILTRAIASSEFMPEADGTG